jgi:FMN phosphatase YigB (HAD superfamily)
MAVAADHDVLRNACRTESWSRVLELAKPQPESVSPLPFDLVIFDCDGVLVDSESITNRLFAAMLNEIGLRVTLADMFERFVGHSMAHGLGLIEDMLGHPPPPEFAEEYQRRTRSELEQHLRPVRDEESAIRAIAAFPLAMCVGRPVARRRPRDGSRNAISDERYRLEHVEVLRAEQAPALR